MGNEPGKPMLRRSFLNAYPVLALKLEAKERDALIRNLPLSLKTAFAFEELMRWLDLDWKSLENVVTVTEGETWITIRYVRPDRGYFEYHIRSVADVDRLIYGSGEISHSGQASGAGYSNVNAWLTSLYGLHHELFIESEIDRLFKQAGWEESRDSFHWAHPTLTNWCRWKVPTSRQWVFWKDSKHYFAFRFEDENIEDVKYIYTGIENPVTREKWLEEFARCISLLTPSSPVKRDSESKRLKI